jgi:hypothetical protein
MSQSLEEAIEMSIIEQANEVVAQMGTDKVRRAHVCGCFRCKAAARNFIDWLADNGNPAETVNVAEEGSVSEV